MVVENSNSKVCLDNFHLFLIQKNNQTIGYFEINAYFCAKYRKSLI